MLASSRAHISKHTALFVSTGPMLSDTAIERKHSLQFVRGILHRLVAHSGVEKVAVVDLPEAVSVTQLPLLIQDARWNPNGKRCRLSDTDPHMFLRRHMVQAASIIQTLSCIG